MSKPTRSFAILVGVAVVAMVLGVVMGRAVRSPAQQALDTAAPGKSVITAGVTSRPTTGQVVTRGTVAVGQTVSIGPVQASTAASIITAVFVHQGQVINAGSRIIEVSGRPVFLLHGTFSAYRNIAVGDSGPDAGQVNKALTQSGLSAPSGNTFTTASSAALAQLYSRFGYSPPAGGGMDMREVVFAPDETATVTAVAARVGGPGKATNLVVMTSGATEVTANMDPAAARAVHVGDPAQVFLDGTGGTLNATVASVSVGSTVATTNLVLTPHGSVEATNNGANVRVVVTQHSTGQTTLSVPVAAVFSEANGQTAVVVEASGQQQVVAVKVGAVVGGFIAVEPASGMSLKVGDQVVVSGPGLG